MNLKEELPLQSGYYWVERSGKIQIAQVVIDNKDGIWELWLFGNDYGYSKDESLKYFLFGERIEVPL